MTVPEENRAKTDKVDEAATGPGRTSPAEQKNQGEPEKESPRESAGTMREALRDAGVDPETLES
ncbi:hypothetical protein [Streptomyces sp. NPDC006267]|uniref:hypothetical protein n=1 Tax=unclassified Streptomyces TaxID=2593676 RepID=UPI0033AAC41E